MSDKEQISPQPQVMQPNDPLVQKLNKLSVKFNAKQMLEQEASEAINEYVNLAQQTIMGLRKEIEGLKAKTTREKFPKEEIKQ